MQTQPRPELEQTYIVSIQPIHDAAQRKSLDEALSRIAEMNKQLDYFYQTIAVGYKEAVDLLQALEKAQIIREEPNRDRTDRSVITYLELLQAIKLEIERERLILESLKNAQEAQEIEVYEPAPETFDAFVQTKVKNAKVQTKKIESSLRVSFSRYQHWINQTVSRLSSIKKALKMA